MRPLRRFAATLLLAVSLAHARPADCGAYPGAEFQSLCPQGVPLFVCTSENGEPDNWHFLGCWAF